MKKIFLMILLVLSAQYSFSQNWDWGGPVDPLQQKFEVRHYRLELELLPETQSIQGSNTVTFSASEKLDTLRLNLIEAYQVSSVLMDGKEVQFNHQNDILDIFPIDCTCDQVQVFYGGKTPIAVNPPWEGGFTWEKDQLGNHWMGLSSQGEGSQIFMPGLDHPSSEPSEGVDIIITVPKPYFVASNGRQIETVVKNEKVTYHWSTSYPINLYNINFTMGIFHEEKMDFLSVSGALVPMHVWVLQENRNKAKSLLEVLKTSTETQEKYFGAFPFPEDKIAVVETPYLGMEHQTINAYGNNFQFVQMGKVQYDWLLHHELGHEWFGNKVSVGDWADMWIHEGLTAYGDWLFYWEHGGPEAYFTKVKSESKNIPHARPVVGPINSTEEQAYHPEIYTKGAMVIHSLRGILGDEIFFPMLKAFASDERFTYQNQVNTNDFIEFVQAYSGKNLQGFFDLYLYSTELPRLKVSKKGKSRYSISLQGIAFEMPLEVLTSEGIQRINAGPKEVDVLSTTPPVVDPSGWMMMKR
ncbi:MAG: M1 family metallopeptidase [Algoriphagus sp.]|uniref:M1 family metallopeptidase n=1 Tax=Algoriphagus sp. TaxID=1872435 RepID=UPI00271770C8|nr:M1 family metallopeptidase [Algoriphagus sp.]MDO8965570.1 M1 family metallopeptidase [Algoriphagus sp.]MDP2039877.1 M1 family metallopeptidase [Algoriphagus sp.]MDP3201610.1 M1 family metallopeptidase [Algoriphagus sp.]MDP3473927.1 M1 family metallopeptidase [Algoriphagus sp.]